MLLLDISVFPFNLIGTRLTMQVKVSLRLIVYWPLTYTDRPALGAPILVECLIQRTCLLHYRLILVGKTLIYMESASTQLTLFLGLTIIRIIDGKSIFRRRKKLSLICNGGPRKNHGTSVHHISYWLISHQKRGFLFYHMWGLFTNATRLHINSLSSKRFYLLLLTITFKRLLFT